MCKPYVLGIDIGGTNTVFGMVDARGEVLASSSIKTKKHSDFNDYLDELHAEVTRMLTDNDAEDKILGQAACVRRNLRLGQHDASCLRP